MYDSIHDSICIYVVCIYTTNPTCRHIYIYIYVLVPKKFGRQHHLTQIRMSLFWRYCCHIPEKLKVYSNSMYIYIYVCTPIIRLYITIYVYMYIIQRVYTYMYIYIYTYSYTHYIYTHNMICLY